MVKNEDSDLILELKHISKSFGRNQVLKGIDLQLKKGSILGLMGENGAGKSTMMKILFGIYSKDDGDIIFDGKITDFKGPKDALENGVAMVHQELNQCVELNALDNIFLGRYPLRFGLIDEKKMSDEAVSLFKKLDMNVNLQAPLKTMTIALRQMVEIAKAVSYDAKIIVLDEPTSSLTEKEVKKLFKIVKDLKKQGVSFIYISHKMDEVFEICDEVSVLRDGQLVLTKKTAETSMNELISAMVGRPLNQRFPEIDNVPGETVLKLDNINTIYDPQLKDINLEIKKGEIFGLYGLIGAGRSELLETLFGLRTIKSGEVYYNGELIHFSNPAAAMKKGFAFITEDRKFNGLFLKSSIEYNTVIANMGKYTKHGIVSNRLLEEACSRQVEQMHTKCMSGKDLITALSGGNQQKVIIGRWLEREPDIFLLDEPTRGIDVGAKFEIYQLIINMAKEGKTCIVVSSEMPEILGITNRIGVMSGGRVAGVVNTKDTNQEELLKLAAMYL